MELAKEVDVSADRFMDRSLALDHEELIDIDEWCEPRGIAHAFPFPSAMTRRLCDAIERVPFRMLPQSTAEERSRRVLERAATALLRGLNAFLEELPQQSLLLEFAAPLPCAGRDWTHLA